MSVDVELTLSDKATRIYNQFVGNVNRQAATMDNTIKSIGTAVGAAFSIGAVASFMKTAADANLQVTKMDQALRNSGLGEYKNELLATADALRDKTAVDDDEIVKLQAQLVGYTGNINAVRQLTPAVLDLAAGTGMSVEAAGKLVARSNEGAEGLKRLGIVIGETTSEEERLEKITKAVAERYGGMAEAFGNTDAGGLQKLSNAMEDLQETAGNVFLKILGPSLPGILKTFDAIGWVIEKTVGTIRVLTTAIMTGLIAPLAMVENQLNMMGVTSSKVFQNMMASGMRQTAEAANELLGRTDAVDNATGKLGGTTGRTATEIVTLRDTIKNLQAELNTLTPGTSEYEAVLRRVNSRQAEWNALLAESNVNIHRSQTAIGVLRNLTEKGFVPKARMDESVMFFKTLKLEMVEFTDMSSVYLEDVNDELDEMNNNINEMAGMFASSLDIVLEANGDTVKQLQQLWDSFFRSLRNQMLEIAAKQTALKLMTGEGETDFGSIFGNIVGSLIGGPVGGFIGGYIGRGLKTSSARASSDVSTSGSRSGMRTVSPSSSNSQSNVTIQIINNAPITSEQALHELGNTLMRKLGVNDISKVWRNDSNGIAMSAA